MGELHMRKQIQPGVTGLEAQNAKGGLEGAIGTFTLTICLGVICGRHSYLCAGEAHEGGPERGDEPAVAVTDDARGYAPDRVDLPIEPLSECHPSVRFLACEKSYGLGKFVSDRSDTVEPTRGRRKALDEINEQRMKWA